MHVDFGEVFNIVSPCRHSYKRINMHLHSLTHTHTHHVIKTLQKLVRYIFYMIEVRCLEVTVSTQKFLLEYMHFD